jgi:hypothetical protein
LIVDSGDDAADGRAVHVDIKHAEEDADPLARTFGCADGYGFGDQTISRRNNKTVAGRDLPLGVSKKPQEEKRKQYGDDAPHPGAGKPNQRNRHSEKA